MRTSTDIMCKLVPVLRVIGFVFLVLAIVACAIGFVVPFWIRMPLEEDIETTTVATVKSDQQDIIPAEIKTQPETDQVETTVTTQASSGIGQAVVDKLSGLLKNGSYSGLWAKCYHNFTCSCFWQNKFEMEKKFPGRNLIIQ